MSGAGGPHFDTFYPFGRRIGCISAETTHAVAGVRAGGNVPVSAQKAGLLLITKSFSGFRIFACVSPWLGKNTGGVSTRVGAAVAVAGFLAGTVNRTG